MANGQCLEITAEEAVKVCSSEQGLLSATTNGTVLFSEWTPTKELVNPLSLNSPITNPFDTTYTLKVRGFLESQNLLTNGDFSAGKTGFTSQYEFESTKPSGYIIGTVGTELFPEAKACEDHTTPEAGGNMMMVRVAVSNNVDIYCQEINVNRNQDYHFQGFATGLVLNSPPVIVLKINEEVVSVGTLGSFACSWQRVSGDWSSGDATTAKICLSVSDEDIGAGTDFVLDDLGFYEVCEVEKKVDVEVVDFTVNAPEQVGLTCGDSLRLNAEIIPGDIYFITEWATTNGNFVSGKSTLFPTVDAIGIYELSVITTIDEQICRAYKTVEVIPINEGELAINKTANLHCQQTEITLETVGDFDFSAYLFQWSSSDGNILSAPTLPTIQVNQPGLYQLERTDLQGNCPQNVEIMVEETSLQDFTFDLMSPDCDNPTGTIVFNETIGGDTPFLYSIDNGETFFPDRIFPNLMGGVYDLMIQDVNGCIASQTTSFEAFTSLQIALPNQVRIKVTDNFKLPLTINLPANLIKNIEWTPAIGLSCTNCVQPTFTSKRSKNYQVVVTDKSDCTAQANIQIQVIEPSDVYLPTAFSPNQDGQNDIFQIHINEERVKKVNRFQIFDRYGNLVFNRVDFLPNNPADGWNGEYKGEAMPIGVYVYWVEVELVDEQIAVFSGEIGLLK